MRAKGFIQDGATYAGHSLGEYGSLSAFSGFLPMNDLMDVVFYRGLSMQLAMEREENGETGYSMVAANPKRVGKGKNTLLLSLTALPSTHQHIGFNEAALNSVVRMISCESKELLEIVNYNVEGEQYVCAGTVSSPRPPQTYLADDVSPLE